MFCGSLCEIFRQIDSMFLIISIVESDHTLFSTNVFVAYFLENQIFYDWFTISYEHWD